MNLLKFFKRNKPVSLSSQAKLEAASTKVTEAFIMFQQADDSIKEADKEIHAFLEENKKEIASLDAQRENKIKLNNRAMDELQANKRLSEKLADFIR